MNPSTFIPKIFVSVGETGAMFTLRETYLHSYGVRRGNCSYETYYEVRSAHIKNLSTTASEAIQKAQEYANVVGLELTSTVESIERDLREIKRTSAEEMVKRRQVEAEREAQWQAERLNSLIEMREHKLISLEAGYLPFGDETVFNKQIKDLPVSYVNWLVKNQNKFDAYSIVWIAAEHIKANFAYMLLPEADKTAYCGVLGKRSTFNVITLSKVSFQRPSYGGYGVETVYVTTMMDKATKACMVVFSSSFCELDPGDEATIKATVKKHDQYKDQAQTVVQRVTVV